MARPAKPKKNQTVAPYGAEVGLALDLIAAGKSDAAIAAAIGSGRPHGQQQCEPRHITDLRNRR